MSDDRRAMLHALSLVGQLGWWVIAPILTGLAIGLALDRRLDTGGLFTILLILAGIAVGIWQAWRLIRRCL